MPTSVPVWTRAAPAADPGGQEFSVLTIGPEASEVGDVWRHQLRGFGRPVHALAVSDAAGDDEDDEAVRWADRQAGAARVGWRFMVAGPEDAVLRCCAAVRTRGGLDAEITAHVTSVARRRVTCAHCRTTTTTTVEVASTCVCDGCARELLIYHHVSRRHASYLGFMVDAEDAP